MPKVFQIPWASEYLLLLALLPPHMASHGLDKALPPLKTWHPRETNQVLSGLPGFSFAIHSPTPTHRAGLLGTVFP